MPILLLLFIGIPLIEIALFIQVGGEIGLWLTLLVVVVTALIGSVALRAQGFSVLSRLQRAGGVDDASLALIEGMLLFSAGLFLLTPGFFTDALGLSLLFPPIRAWAARFVRKRSASFVSGGFTSHSGQAQDWRNTQRRPEAAAPSRPSGANPPEIEDAEILNDNDASPWRKE